MPIYSINYRAYAMAFWDSKDALFPKQQHRWIISLDGHDSAVRGDVNNNLLPSYVAKSVDKPTFSLKTQQVKYLYSHTFNFPTRVVWNPIKITFYDVIINHSKQGLLFSPAIGPDGVSIVETKTASPIGNPLETEVQQSTQVFFYKFLQQAGYFNPEELSREDQLLRFRSYTFKKDMVRGLVGISGNERNNADYINPRLPIGSEDKQRYSSDNVVNTELFNSLKIKELSPDGSFTEIWKLYNPLISDVTFDKLDYTQDNIMSITCTIAYDYAELEPKITKINYPNIPRYESTTVQDLQNLSNSIFKIPQEPIGVPDIFNTSRGQASRPNLDLTNRQLFAGARPRR